MRRHELVAAAADLDAVVKLIADAEATKARKAAHRAAQATAAQKWRRRPSSGSARRIPMARKPVSPKPKPKRISPSTPLARPAPGAAAGLPANYAEILRELRACLGAF